MTRKANIINYLLTMALTLISLFVIIFLCNERYNENLANVIIKFVVGAIVAGFIHTLFHELGHIVAGKKNGFVFSAVTIWFLKWFKLKNKIKFKFTMFGEEAGYTEMIPVCQDQMEIRLRNYAFGGLIASLIVMLIGVPSLFIVNLPAWVFCIWSMLFPIGVYFFFGNFLPASNYGVRNDGGTIYGLKHNDQSLTVAVNILKIQAELYQGKTPSQVDKSLYFDLPQLPEDDLNFILLLNARYLYYLDCEDFENAKKITERLVSLIDEIPKEYRAPIMVDLLYNSCTFALNPHLADEITEDYEKFLNNVNTATVVRAKLAYLTYIKGQTDCFDLFYNKGIKEARRCQIKGLGLFETKLFDKMKEDCQSNID